MAACHNWASLPGPLVDAFCCLASSQDLAQCSLVCRGWHAALRGSGAPWEAALRQEFGYGAHLRAAWPACPMMLPYTSSP